MRSFSRPAVLVLSGDPADPVVKQASALLDQSGLSYVTKAAGVGEKPHRRIRVSSGTHSVCDFSRQELVEFLWAHGARFEDS